MCLTQALNVQIFKFLEGGGYSSPHLQGTEKMLVQPTADEENFGQPFAIGESANFLSGGNFQSWWWVPFSLPGGSTIGKIERGKL